MEFQLKYLDLTYANDLYTLKLINAESDNSFTTTVMEEYLLAFERIEQHRGNTALLITCDHHKTFSTGINLAWLQDQDKAGRQAFEQAFNRVMCRLASLDVPTVACINGNAYAGGAILAAAADFRLMRADRGRFCLPEVNIKIPFSPISNDIVHLLPNKQALKTMMLTGVAYTGEECLARDIVDELHPQTELQQAARAMATTLAAKDRATYTTIRNGMRGHILQHLKTLNPPRLP